MRNMPLLLCFLILTTTLSAQTPELRFQPRTIPGLPALHSFAWAKWQNKLLVLGGRTDGLHQKQPFAAFHPRYRNDSIFVIDLLTEKVWSSSLTGLSADIKDQLQSTNMEFQQQHERLLCVGGYGFGDATKKFTTYPALLELQIPEIIEAIQNNQAWEKHITRISHNDLAVCGGYLGYLNNTYYLVGGHRFDGKYNPHGPDHGPGFTQQYTDQIRRFKRTKKGSIKWLKPITDTNLLHRRDMNVLPQYRTNGRIGLTIFSGVFQRQAELPYKTLVDIDDDKIKEVPNFEQRFSHYHNAHLPIYDQNTSTTYNLFFGGIAEYYRNEKGEIIQNNILPFTRNISLITRNKMTIKEELLPLEFPELLGASAMFIPTQTELFDQNGILLWDKLPAGEHHVGFIMGGILSTGRIIFWPGDKDSSQANQKIWDIYLIKK